MSIVGMTINEWISVAGVALAGLWGFFKITATQKEVKDDVAMVQREIHHVTENQTKNLRELKKEIDTRIVPLEVDLKNQAAHYAALAATIMGLQNSVQNLGIMIHGLNTRIDNYLLREKDK